MKSVIVYSKSGCPFCSLLKNHLRTKRIDFTEIDVSEDSVRFSFYQSSNTNSVPQLYVIDAGGAFSDPNAQAFGGWDTVSKDWQTLEIAARS